MLEVSLKATAKCVHHDNIQQPEGSSCQICVSERKQALLTCMQAPAILTRQWKSQRPERQVTGIGLLKPADPSVWL